MSIVLLADYRAMLREAQSVELDAVLQSHLDAAELEASKFVGFDIALEFDPDPVPADIKAAAMFLAQTMTDQMPPEECNIRRARAESLLRPYRRETGIAA